MGSMTFRQLRLDCDIPVTHLPSLDDTITITNGNLRRVSGAVYTPTLLASYVAEKLAQFYWSDTDTRPVRSNDVFILDPACGDGQLLLAAHAAVALHAPRLGRINLLGSDIDASAANHAAARLRASGAYGTTMCLNALAPAGAGDPLQAWRSLLTARGGTQTVDMAILNPPWGADVTPYLPQLRLAGYRLLRGQFDSSDLFVELAQSLVRHGGCFAMIVPDSLFALEREPLRQFLLDRTEVLCVARLGEGLFDAVYRGCAVVVCRNIPPRTNTVTQCFRLTPAWRRRVLDGTNTLADAERELSHVVPQSRFRDQDRGLLDIEVRADDAEVLQVLRFSGYTLSSYLVSGRGVELSKSGEVTECFVCGLWLPRPRKASRCPHCGHSFGSTKLRHETIVANTQQDGYKPLIVGEDVARHRIRSYRWIDTTRRGINFKSPELFSGPKLLVRKTGVGISAAMDYTDALTNQVVYILKRRTDLPDWLPIEFAAALVCSRAAYYFVAKAYGEIEWRSHPYVTQTHILSIPAPDPYCLQPLRGEVLEVAAALRRECTEGNSISRDTDIAAERLVAAAFGLSRRHYEIIYRELDAIEELLPVRALKSIQMAEII